MNKDSWLTYLCDIVCWKIPQVHYIDLSEIVHFVKAVIIVTSVHLNLSQFLVSHFLRTKVSPKWSLNQGFGTQKKCPFPRNRGVSSTEVTETKIMWTFFQDKIVCPLNGGVPKEEVPL